MTVAVFAGPSAPRPAAPPPTLPVGYAQTWTGWDGSVWVLEDPSSPVRMLEGVRGLDLPPRQRYTSQSPSRPGSRYRGGRDLEREVYWPLLLHHPDAGQEWIDLADAFWRTMDPARPGTWTVTRPDGLRKRLRCRFDEDGSAGLMIDPALSGWQFLELYLVAEDPYWCGEPVARTFQMSPDVRPFIDEAGGPPFWISPDTSGSVGTIDNPGDVDAWPVWTVRDATTALTLGVGDALLGVSVELDDGDVLVIDTERQTTTLNGERVRGILSPHDFAPVPAGGTSELSLVRTGTGSISVELVPRYRRGL